MPNGTLCGKAVVEMLMASRNDEPLEDIQEKLVQDGNLPRSYLISRARMTRCKQLDSVEVQDRKGEVGVGAETPRLSARL